MSVMEFLRWLHQDSPDHQNQACIPSSAGASGCQVGGGGGRVHSKVRHPFLTTSCYSGCHFSYVEMFLGLSVDCNLLFINLLKSSIWKKMHFSRRRKTFLKSFSRKILSKKQGTGTGISWDSVYFPLESLIMSLNKRNNFLSEGFC